MIEAEAWELCFQLEDICKLVQLHTHTHTVQRQPYLGHPQLTSRACLRRDRGTSEAVWQI